MDSETTPFPSEPSAIGREFDFIVDCAMNLLPSQREKFINDTINTLHYPGDLVMDYINKTMNYEDHLKLSDWERWTDGLE